MMSKTEKLKPRVALTCAVLALGLGIGLLTNRYDQRVDRARTEEVQLPLPDSNAKGDGLHVAPDQQRDVAILKVPFIGDVRTTVRKEEATIEISDGPRRTMEFQVFDDDRGQFFRAAFYQAGARNYEDPPDAVQEGMKVRSEKITGLAKNAPAIPWTKILDELECDVPMDKVTQMSITYVEYQFWDQPPKPVYLIHVFGAMTPSINIPNIPENRRIRFVADEQGKVFRFDNCL